MTDMFRNNFRKPISFEVRSARFFFTYLFSSLQNSKSCEEKFDLIKYQASSCSALSKAFCNYSSLEINLCLRSEELVFFSMGISSINIISGRRAFNDTEIVMGLGRYK